MKLRAPAVPLINSDPYFSVWSMSDKLNESTVKHWTGSDNTLIGSVEIDGKEYIFMGDVPQREKIRQESLTINAMNTLYTFKNEQIKLKVDFLSPLFPDDMYYISRPISYMCASYKSLDGKRHRVKVNILASEEYCLNKKGEGSAKAEKADISGLTAMKIGNETQKPLNKSGDDIRINWGYFYLAVKGKAVADTFYCDDDKMRYIMLSKEVKETAPALFLFAYDDIQSINYFGKPLEAFWKRSGRTIEEEIAIASSEYEELLCSAVNFSDILYSDAVKAGGEKYAEILLLAYRQIFASHKLAADENDEILFISKECFSNGCAATVDVSYPSIPFFLIYNPELVKGMMRPIFKLYKSDKWEYDFAPHDAGQYPILNGQVYMQNKLEYQMPVEECGNMLIMCASLSLAQNDASFAMDNIDVLEKWAYYLEKYGADPDNQLCTDDFAGHLAHNCNLSLKAIMGLAGLALIYSMSGNKAKYQRYIKIARDMAKTWQKNASNGDGSYRLAFDREGTFSMKYNAVWDKLFNTGLFPKEMFVSELAKNRLRFNPYGMPLDNRETYTKSDWLVWTATLADDKDTFCEFIEPLWRAYHHSPSRSPLPDWYDTVTSLQECFQHRSVQGGLYIKLMEYYRTLEN